MTQTIHDIIRDEIHSYDRFASGQLKVIGLPEAPETDSVVCEHFSYGQWVAAAEQYPVVKVEGLEDIPYLMDYFRHVNPVDIHLFVSNREGYSFGWHEDYVNVYLFVVDGLKKVYMKTGTSIITNNQGVYIPERTLHRVWSQQGTWALSIGVER